MCVVVGRWDGERGECGVCDGWGMMWQLSSTEVEKLLDGFEDGSLLAENGLFLGSAKYMVLQGEAGVVIRGKKVRLGVTVDGVRVGDESDGESGLRGVMRAAGVG